MTDVGPRNRVVPWSERASLVPLARLAAANAAADGFVAVALADTLFFGVPVGAARGRVALYLLVTMLPFAVVAPVIGPLVDRFRGGRRWVFAVTMAGRAVLAWAMAGTAGGLALFPAAFGVLVLSKAWGVTRAAAVPRLLPPGMTLVGGNARLSATSLVSGTAGGLFAVAVVRLTDFTWALRGGALLFGIATVFALALPAAVNGVAADVAPAGARREPVRAPRFPAVARAALAGALSLRAVAGLLTTFLAFLLRARGHGTVGIGAVAGAAAVGSLAGTLLGAVLPDRPPRALLFGALAGAGAAGMLGVLRPSYGVGLVAAGAVGLAGALGRLSFDAVLQRELADEVRGQAFARAETALQLAWVAGGACGILLPLHGRLGFAVVVAAVVAGGMVARRTERATGGAPHPARHPG